MSLSALKWAHAAFSGAGWGDAGEELLGSCTHSTPMDVYVVKKH